MNYNAMINTAFAEVRSVCSHLLQAYDRMNSQSSSREGIKRFMETTDGIVQSEIIEGLKRKYPRHHFVAEEPSELSEKKLSDHPEIWVIDPIDGSHNYMHHIPYFAISICFYHKGEAAFALVYDPIHDELFTAIKGNGALLNQHRIQVSKLKKLEEACTGVETQTGQNLPPLSYGYSIRKLGCTSLSLCYLACGRFDLAVCQSPHIWDCAAGMLIAMESGALIYNQKTEVYRHGDDYLYASNKDIRDQIECL